MTSTPQKKFQNEKYTFVSFPFDAKKSEKSNEPILRRCYKRTDRGTYGQTDKAELIGPYGRAVGPIISCLINFMHIVTVDYYISTLSQNSLNYYSRI